MTHPSVILMDRPTDSRPVQMAQGKPVKLEIVVVHHEDEGVVQFTLDRHLLGEHDGSFFVYDGKIVGLDSAPISTPLVSKCATPSVRWLLNELRYQRHIELVSFSLLQATLRYSKELGFDRTVRIFAEACAKSRQVGSNEAVVVHVMPEMSLSR